jgi:DNA-binding beta-propeller fold protein YncE
MRGRYYLYAGTLVSSLAIGFGLWTPSTQADINKSPGSPKYRVDPFWPKPLPDNWVTGEVAGTCIDSNDHVFTVNRGPAPGGLVAPETVVATPSPAVIEFDPAGNVVNSWGNLGILPNGLHGCFVDYQDNVWIAGNGDGIVQKYSHDGKVLLLQIGTRGLCDSATGACGNFGAVGTSQTLLNQPADVAVDPENGDIYIADGYGNHRVVVFDKTGQYLRQWGGVVINNNSPEPGSFAAGDGGHPHCVVLGNDKLLYVCDRADDRIQVFDKMGNLKRVITVKPGTGVTPQPNGSPGLGTAGSAWDVDFSPDRHQTFMFEADGGNEVLWIFDRAFGQILSGFGRPGHMAGDFTFLHTVTIDSRGNLYTGETIGGRRVQKFVKKDGHDHDHDRDHDHDD